MKNKKSITILMVAFTLASCQSYKRVPYLQSYESLTDKGYKEIVINEVNQQDTLYDARIQPKDLLSITVNTSDPQAAAPFNLTMQTSINVAQANSTYVTSQPTLQQYLVNNEGEIDFPVIGKLKIGGLTKTAAEKLVREQLRPYLKETPIVTVRMSNYKISVIGEVNHPGTFTINNEKVNLFEALAMAGDMTVYGIRSNVKLIREDNNGQRTNNALAAMQDFGMFSMTSNFDNEVEILKSRTLIKKVVSHLNLYINIAQKQPFGYDIPLYKDTPFDVFMTAEEADKLDENILLDLTYDTLGKLSAEVSYTQDNEKQKAQKSFDKLPAILPLPIGVITISGRDSLSIPTEPIKLKVTISKPTAVAIGYSSALTIEPTSKTSTIAAVSLKNTNVQRAIDFINDLIAVYNIDTNTEKNEVAQKSADFIEERIGIINNELGTTENELAAFKQRAGLTDLSSDAQLALQESSKYEQQYAENATQINLVTYLRDYINNPDNNDEVIPANVGLSDVNLASAIEKYNNLVVERKRLLRTSSESNPAIINLNTGIEAMRHNVKTTVNSVLKGLQITRNNIDRQSRKYESRISNAPKQEQEFMTISRQQEIKATLYIMLLQKREENAITLAATANNGRIIEEPIPGGIVSPKGKLIYIIALVIGIGIPISIIYLLNLLRFRIEGHTDVEKLTTVPIIGDIPLTDAGKNGTPTIAVRENDNNIMAETFRSLRTNLLFIMGDPDKKVILVTSTISGEGKTFMASNLAVSLALLGKKVILVGLDIRKPGLNKIFHLSHKEKGITQYLAAPQSTDLHALIQPSGITSNLDLLLGGPIPPNPTELLARQSLEDTISTLRKEYDYIVLDTAPIGMVTDTLILSRVADASIYVCRADYTHKTDYQLINELQEHHRLPNLCTVVNGIDMKKKKYGYYYGYGKYGKYYGYGKKYGYS